MLTTSKHRKLKTSFQSLNNIVFIALHLMSSVHVQAHNYCIPCIHVAFKIKTHVYKGKNEEMAKHFKL